MRAIMLAAGLGTRLRPLTDVLPKPMVTVVDRPLMAHTLDLLERYGVERALANLHHLPDVIESYFGARLAYAREGRLLGTAGAVRAAADFFGDETGLVVYADTLTDIDVTELAASHSAAGAAVTISVKRMSELSGLGVVLAGDDGRVLAFQEKPDPREALSDLVSCAVYCFEPEVLDHFPCRPALDWGSDVFPALLEQDVPLHAHVIGGYYNDMGSAADLRRGCLDLVAGRVDLPLDPSAALPAATDGPAWVGPGCEIGPGVTLHGPVAIGAGARLGAGATVRESVLLPGAEVEAGAVVEAELCLPPRSSVSPGSSPRSSPSPGARRRPGAG